MHFPYYRKIWQYKVIKLKTIPYIYDNKREQCNAIHFPETNTMKSKEFLA